MSDSVRFFVSRQPAEPLLLRRVGVVDEAFLDGRWQPTKVIVDYMFGNDDFVETISEADARKIAPAAFG